MGAQELSKVQFALYQRELSRPLYNAKIKISHAHGIILRAKRKQEKEWQYAELPLTTHKENDREKIISEVEEIFSELPQKINQKITWPPELQFAWDSLWSGEAARIIDGYFSNALLGASFSSASELSKLINEKLENGYKTIKIKISTDNYRIVAQTIQNMELDAAVKFRLDANGCFNLQEAERMLSTFSIDGAKNIEYCEDPCEFNEQDSWERLSCASAISLALDEPIRSMRSLKEFSESVNTKIIFVIKPSLLGSWNKINEVIMQNRSAGRKIIISSALETEVGLRALVNFAIKAMPVGSVFGVGTLDLFLHPFTKIDAKIKGISSPNEAEKKYLNKLNWKEVAL